MKTINVTESTGSYYPKFNVCKGTILLSLFLSLLLPSVSNAVNTIIPGVTESSGTVDAHGNYTYSVPLQVMPGVNGHTPQHSFEYNSGNQKSGMMGVGWNFAGIPVIHRCGKTIAIDGERGGVNHSISDRLCLDGRRLLATTGASDRGYWSSNASYHTADGSINRIERIAGSCRSSKQESFCGLTFHKNDGGTLEFSNSGGTNTAMMAGPSNHSAGKWYLSKDIDKNGNEIVYTYFSSGRNDLVPKWIKYGYHNVDFNYDTLSVRGQRSGYFGAADENNPQSFKYTKRLKSIYITEHRGGQKKAFKIGYDDSYYTGRDLVQYIRECDSMAMDNCYADLEFDYKDTARAKFYKGYSTYYGTFMGGASGHINDGDYRDAQIIPGDWNGNGRTDLMRIQTDAATSNQGTGGDWYHNNENYGFAIWNPSTTSMELRHPTENDFQNAFDNQAPDLVAQHEGSGMNVFPGDFNGDGQLDFIAVEYGAWAVDNINSFRVYLGNGYVDNSGLMVPTFTMHTPNDNSEQSDIKGSHDPSGPVKQAGVNIIVGDFDGDGKDDFVRQELGEWGVSDANNFNIFYSDGDGTFSKIINPIVDGKTVNSNMTNGVNLSGISLVAAGEWYARIAGSVIATGDFNGDGKTDITRQHVGNWANNTNTEFAIYYSTDTRGEFDESDTWSPKYKFRGEPSFVNESVAGFAVLTYGDFNGDGKTDIIRQDADTWDNNSSDDFEVYLSKGKVPNAMEYELVTTYNHNMNTELGWGNGKLEKWKVTDSPEPNLITEGYELTPGDFNGDGLTDFIARQKAELINGTSDFRVYYSNGDGTFYEEIPTSTELQDEVQGMHWKTKYSDASKKHKFGVQIVLGDYDGDGRTDFFAQEYGYGTAGDSTVPTAAVWINGYKHSKQPADVMSRVRTASESGMESVITYGELTDVTLDASNTVPAGFHKFMHSKNVVTQVVSGAYSKPYASHYITVPEVTMDYTYGYPVRHSESAFLGFTYMETRSSQTNTSTQKKFTFLEKNGVAVSRVSEVLTESYNREESISKVTTTWAQVDFWSYGAVITRPTQMKTYIYAKEGSISKTEDYHYGAYNWLVLTNYTDGNKQWGVLEKQRNMDNRLWKWQTSDAVVCGDHGTMSGTTPVCSGSHLSWTSFKWDGSNNMSKMSEFVAPGVFLHTDYEYDSYGNRTMITSPNGLVSEITYETKYHTYPATKTVDPSGANLQESWTYDFWGNVKSHKDVNGYDTQKTYDSMGRLTEVKKDDDSGSLKKVEAYDRALAFDTRANAYSMELTKTTYLDWTESNTRVDKTYFDEQGKKIYFKDGGGDSEKKWEYDASGRVTKEYLPKLSAESWSFIEKTYDSRGRLSAVIPPSGDTVTYTYATESYCNAQVRSNLIQVKIDDGASSNFDQWKCMSIGDVEEGQIFNRGSQWQYHVFTFDDAGRMLASTDGHTTTTNAHNGLGQKTQVVNNLRGTENFTYSTATGLMDRWEHKGTDGSTLMGGADFLYDIQGRQTKATYNDGRVVEYRYDKASNKAKGQIWEEIVKDPSSTTILERQFSYDSMGNISALQVTMGEKTHTLATQTNPQGGVTKKTYPSGRVVYYDYHNGSNEAEKGLLHTIKDSSTTYATYSDYTAAGQAQHVDYDNGVGEVRAFANNRISGVTIYKGATNYLDQELSYNKQQRLSRINDRTSANDDISYTYGSHQYITSSRGPWGTKNYEYDDQVRMTKKDGAYMTWTNGMVSGWGNSTYTYNKAGSRISKTWNGAGPFTTTYTYDDRQKMRTATTGSKVTKYWYDGAGNRIIKKNADGSTIYYFMPEMEVQVNGATKKATDYINGPEGRVAAVTVDSSGYAMMGFHHNSMMGFHHHSMMIGMLNTGTISGAAKWIYHTIAKYLSHPKAGLAVPGVVLAFLSIVVLMFIWNFFRSAQTLSLLGSLRAVMANYLTKAGLMSAIAGENFAKAYGTEFMRQKRGLAMATPVVMSAMLLLSTNTAFAANGDPNTGTQYFHSNKVGSTTLVTDNSGNLVANPIYLPYGEVYSGGDDSYRYGFGGKEVDSDTGLQDFEARDYDPELGMFIQADTHAIGTTGQVAASMNRYAYAGNDPINNADPSGNFIGLLITAVIAIVALVSTAAIGEAISASIGRRAFNARSFGLSIAIGAIMMPIGLGIGSAFSSLSTAALITGSRLTTSTAGALFASRLTSSGLSSAIQTGAFLSASAAGAAAGQGVSIGVNRAAGNGGSWSWASFGIDIAFDVSWAGAEMAFSKTGVGKAMDSNANNRAANVARQKQARANLASGKSASEIASLNMDIAKDTVSRSKYGKRYMELGRWDQRSVRGIVRNKMKALNTGDFAGASADVVRALAPTPMFNHPLPKAVFYGAFKKTGFDQLQGLAVRAANK